MSPTEAANASSTPDETRTHRDNSDSRETDALLADDPDDDTQGRCESERELSRSLRSRAFVVRALALLCACSLSIGSHYATYILAPLKSRLSREMGTSNTEFSLLISAFTLNSTWTPLIGGIMASRLGTTTTSIFATGVILIGLLLLLVGDVAEDVRLMTSGMFIFGLGVSPLAVVQETIIVRFFRSHGLGMSMAFGLVAGKAASFVSARTSYPLSQYFGPHAPFYAAAVLASVSFAVNLTYVSVSRWLVAGAGAELEVSELRQEARRYSIQDMSEAEALERVTEKKRVRLKDMTQLGDVFWAYIGVNVLCGSIWHPFTHLAANVIENRYGLTESDASIKASYLLAGSIFLYPLVGFVIDRVKRPSFVLMLFMLSSLLTMFAYIWLVLPPEMTGTPWPAIASFATGIGFSPLLLVVIVPELVPMKYVSTTLGAHKSLEQTGTTISQTLAGLMLDHMSPDDTPFTGDKRVQNLLSYFLTVNLAQLLGIFGLWYLDRRQRMAAIHHQRSMLHESDEEVTSLTEVAKEDSDDGDSTEFPQLLGSESSLSHHGPPRAHRSSACEPLLRERPHSHFRYSGQSFKESWKMGWILTGLDVSLNYISVNEEIQKGQSEIRTLLGVGPAVSNFTSCSDAVGSASTPTLDPLRPLYDYVAGLLNRADKMGAYKYIGELYKKKQSDVLRFLLRVRCWEYRQLNVIHRASRASRPDKARRLGYKAKQGYVIYRVRVRRGNRKKHVPKGATYGKPVHQGVNHLKFQRGLRSVAEERVGRRCGNLRVLNSYWINQDGVYKYYEVILVDPNHKAIRRDPKINWITAPVHKRREARGLTSIGKQNRGLGKGHRYNHTPRVATWKKHNTLSLRRYRPHACYALPIEECNFAFYNGVDPTHGTVDYVDRDTAFGNGLAYVMNDSKVIMKGDDTSWLASGQNRQSVRVSSYAQYNTGLFVLDVDRAPWGCGVWPAFWTLGNGVWPQTGEIDIIEGVHDNEHNQVTWHTNPGCTLTPTANFTGSIVQSNGQPNLDCQGGSTNPGCGITEWSRASYGPTFDSQGGGVFAMKWDQDGIAVWGFYRVAVPQDIEDGSPNPANWGIPVAMLAQDNCDPLTYFVNHSIIFDITFCGDWAGNSYATSGCPGTCSDRIMDPGNFVNASWIINTLKVYRRQNITSRSLNAATHNSVGLATSLLGFVVPFIPVLANF
ncbi:hypothetical protein EW146_g3741 [Bondarzewia mesenterica]|uniref:Ribosomal protein L15 n=1 Tax=Bondarzewia mesenterica TaxID=1095465 RepID=A0A4S4LXZ7_9AGAM|nr:hypothetical protein EW146_g3741 [Bondarzewia mesenterica]